MTRYITSFFALLVLLQTSSMACDLSSLSLVSLVDNHDGTYNIRLRFCVGSGNDGSQSGGSQGTTQFKFQFYGNTVVTQYPASFTSSATGVTVTPSVVTATNINYANFGQFYACVNAISCGQVQSLCADADFVVTGLPDSVRFFGAEAHGNFALAAGCNGEPDMLVKLVCDLGANAGNDATVYYGYGPQSCTVLTASGSQGTAPYTYQWSNGVNTASNGVCPSVTTVYTVTVTDARGCVATDQVTVNAIDVRCGSALTKVNVCHNGRTQCLNLNQVAAHLAHGDVLGGCGASKMGEETEAPAEFALEVFPNPVRDAAEIRVTAEADETATLGLFDMQGRLVKTIFSGDMLSGETHTVQLDAGGLPGGMYFVRYSGSVHGSVTHKVLVQQ